MTTIEDITKSFEAEAKNAVKAVLAANGKTRWNQDDSACAILDIGAALNDAKIEAVDNPDFDDKQRGAALDALQTMAKGQIYQLCNPSQFRQLLEKAKLIPTAGTKTTKVASLIAGL